MQYLDFKTQGPDLAGDARPASVAIGLFAAADFGRAQSQIPGLSSYSDYQDWRDAREGLQMGLAMAGVEAALVPVRLDSFLGWSALAGTMGDEAALDSFARLALTAAGRQRYRIFASVEESDFSLHRGAARATFGRVGYERWRQRRTRQRANALAAGLAVEDQPIRLRDFFDWSDCIGQRASEAMLDRYARLLVEHFLND